MRRSWRRRVVPAVVAAIALPTAAVIGIGLRPPESKAAAPVLLAAGDIEGCGAGQATAKVIAGIDGTVAALGDNAYPNGSASDYAKCYDPTWGQFKDRTHPVPGNHDYDTPNAAGYFGYFGAAAGPPGKGWYSYDLGGWHIVALNANCSDVDCSAERSWLDSDLSAHPVPCILAYWHQPRFSSGSAGDNSTLNAFWKVLYAHNASVVLSGHDHDYERFAPQDPSGHQDPGRGIRQFVVGTGGGALGSLYGTDPNSEIRNNRTFGVLQLSLRPDGYDWRFIPAAGGNFTDAGTDTCSGATPATTAPVATPAPPDEPDSPAPTATTVPPDAEPDTDQGPVAASPPAPATSPETSGRPAVPTTTAAPARSSGGRSSTGPAAPLSAGTPAVTTAGSSTEAATPPPTPPTPTSSPPSPPPAAPPDGAAIGAATTVTAASAKAPAPPAETDLAMVDRISRLARPRSRQDTPQRSGPASVAVAVLLLDGFGLAAVRRRQVGVGRARSMIARVSTPGGRVPNARPASPARRARL